MSRSTARLLLLAVVVLTPMLSLQAAGWVAGLERATLLAAAGLALGAALCRWQPRDWRIYQSLAVLAGFGITVLVFAPLASPGSRREQVEAVLERVWHWGATAVQGGAGTDTLILALALGLLGWTLGLVGATSVLGAHSPWWPVLPGIVVLLVNISVGPSGLLIYLIVYLPAALAIVGQTQLDRWHADWRREGLAVEPAILGRATAVTLVLSLMLVGVAWALPANSHHAVFEELRSRLARPVEGTLRGAQLSLDRLFPSARGSHQVAGALAFAPRMEPRSSAELGDRIILEVASPRPGYWRAATYDRYTGSAMVSTRTLAEDLAADEPWPEAITTADSQVVQQRVTLLAAQTQTVLAMETPYQLSLDSEWRYRAAPGDIESIAFANPLRRGQTYTVLSSVPEVTVEQLREVSEPYPDWVQMYLQLPPNLPERVRDQASRLSASPDNDFDRAVSIESYLRRMTYSTTDVSVPPEGQDWVDYLLFETRTGYCDFFATAMAVMLRTQGIPARVASGYATGEYDAYRNAYVVREDRAHSWVEAYFPTYGWITFEPSAIQGLPDRPSESADVALGDQDLSVFDDMEEHPEFWFDEEIPYYLWEQQTGGRSLLLALLLVPLAAGLAGLGALAFVWRRDLQRLERHERPYAELQRLARWLVGPAPGGLTPLEFGDWLAGRVPALQPHLNEVVHAYAAARYGGRSSGSWSPGPVRRWRSTRLLLLRKLLRHQVHRLDEAIGRLLG